MFRDKQRNIDNEKIARSDWARWYRPADQPVFTVKYGNNHDAILFVEEDFDYPYYMIVSHKISAAHLWGIKEFSLDSAEWELVSDEYEIAGHYEYVMVVNMKDIDGNPGDRKKFSKRAIIWTMVKRE